MRKIPVNGKNVESEENWLKVLQFGGFSGNETKLVTGSEPSFGGRNSFPFGIFSVLRELRFFGIVESF